MLAGIAPKPELITKLQTYGLEGRIILDNMFGEPQTFKAKYYKRGIECDENKCDSSIVKMFRLEEGKRAKRTELPYWAINVSDDKSELQLLVIAPGILLEEGGHTYEASKEKYVITTCQFEDYSWEDPTYSCPQWDTTKYRIEVDLADFDWSDCAVTLQDTTHPNQLILTIYDETKDNPQKWALKQRVKYWNSH